MHDSGRRCEDPNDLGERSKSETSGPDDCGQWWPSSLLPERQGRNDIPALGAGRLGQSP